MHPRGYRPPKGWSGEGCPAPVDRDRPSALQEAGGLFLFLTGGTGRGGPVLVAGPARDSNRGAAASADLAGRWGLELTVIG